MPAILTTIAFLLLAATPGIGYFSQKTSRKWPLRLLIVLLFATSFYLFNWANGFEYALFFSLFLITLPAYLWIYVNSTRKPEKSPKRTHPYQSTASVWYKLFMVIMAGPLALAMAIILSAAITYLLPLLALNRLVVMIMLVPLLWGLIAVWLTATSHLSRTSVILISISCLSIWGLQ
ncbi:hypothetical protein [Marinicella gelatinilytica]|uniref:hypothetical protein n=1 Tax=Marinicella gelatinilytica TaxID=2996017 RepID=UPI002260D8AF|nr:hypothetical protein [Marinicella gelatinilytica]MCX7545675.1 hypothetical protein [Marinicella gelatinilytica]